MEASRILELGTRLFHQRIWISQLTTYKVISPKNVLWKGIFFFQNNTKTQTTSLVSTFSKQFSKLTSRVQETRFCYAKSSVLNSFSMELESLRLDFQQTQKEKQQSIIKPKTQTRKKQWNVIKPKDPKKKMKEFSKPSRGASLPPPLEPSLPLPRCLSRTVWVMEI